MERDWSEYFNPKSPATLAFAPHSNQVPLTMRTQKMGLGPFYPFSTTQ
jgi:hypothetical protein